MPALAHEPSLLAPSSSSGSGPPPPLFEEGVSALHGPAKRYLQPMSLGLGGQVPKRGRHIAEILDEAQRSGRASPPHPDDEEDESGTDDEELEALIGAQPDGNGAVGGVTSPSPTSSVGARTRSPSPRR